MIPAILGDVRRNLRERPQVRKALDSVSWLTLDKFFRIGIGLTVGIWVARHLGPERFGQLSYAMAFVSMFVVVTYLGLGTVLVQRLVQSPEETPVLLGSAFGLKLAAGAAAWAVAVVVATFKFSGAERVLLGMILLQSAVIIFQQFDVLDNWFHARMQSRYSVWARNFGVAVSSAAKVGLILAGAGTMAFIGANIMEMFVGVLALAVLYRLQGGGFSTLRYRKSEAISLLKQGGPLGLSVVLATFYGNVDILMLKELSGDAAAGTYAVAVKIIDVWYTVPTAIVAALMPAIVNTRKHSEELYRSRTQKLLVGFFWMGLAVAAGLTLFSPVVVRAAFGTSYLDAAAALGILAWSVLIVQMGIVGMPWLMLEGLSWYPFIRNAMGIAMNVVLNLVLVPRYGVKGAAVATLISQTFASYLVDAFSSKSRPLFILKSRALFGSLPLTVLYLKDLGRKK